MIHLLLGLFISFAEAKTTYSCDINYDQMNIPHVKTTSLEGFYYCFGLNHGKDRAWEMDFFRRVGEGRNAEVLGFSQMKSDLMMKLLDLPSKADELWEKFPEDKKKWLQIYAEGVNEGFRTGKNSKEFKDKGYEPEDWKPQHTILVLLLQSFDQTRKTFIRDYEEEKLKAKWGNDAATLFNEDNMPWDNTILKAGEYKKSEEHVSFRETKATDLRLWGMFPQISGPESGSNNWVVSKAKSKSGKAMLANDPHLDLKTPLFWYWINLKTPDVTVMGGSVPGVPVIASGTNGKVAWGLTNSYLNSADAIFVSGLKDDQVESFRPTVWIKFWFLKIPFFFKSFEKLKSGHRILPLDIESDHKLALRWTGFSMKAEELYPMFDLFKMQNVTEMDSLIATIGIPSWNFVFADQKGDIGYRLVGKTFKHQGKLPLGMATMTYDELQKVEYLSPDERPHVLKPQRNYVYSANNRHWPSDSKFYGGRGYSYSFRGFRIDEMLQGQQDVESFRNIQCDRQVVDARFFVEKILKNIDIPELKNWNMIAEDSSKVLPVYRRFMDLLMDKWDVNEYALFKMLDTLSPAKKDDMKDVYKTALSEIDGRSWGEFHRVGFEHMSKNTEWIFSPDIAGIGDSHSIDPGTAWWNEDRKVYEQYSGASMRMIVELDETPKIWLTLPGLNRNYDQKTGNSPWDAWKNCQYTQVEF